MNIEEERKKIISSLTAARLEKNLPEARLQAIDEQISFRVKELLSLPRK